MRLCLPGILPVLCGLLSVASPGITPNTAGPDLTAEVPVENDDGDVDSSVVKHSLSIPGLSSQGMQKNVIIDSTVPVKLECNLLNDFKGSQINNVSWRHGEEQIRSNLYMYNNTDNQWHTSYEFVVTDLNQTGNYSCVFSSKTEVKGTFQIHVPAVHGVSKSLVSYNGDSIVMKCDSSAYKPVEWIWYRVTEDRQVALNFTLSAKYKHHQEKRNETKLHIADLSEGDSGTYVCKAIFKTGESEGQVHLNVLSYMVPLRVFLAIAAEVAVLVAVILGYEMFSKRKQGKEDVRKDDEQLEQTAQLKSVDSSSADESSTRQRK
ncbi:embigin [Pseudophryne corroboree]|uniref:embigin n=1 Tax=Pseudophryne corroboree TaxID=495146 RepID=UPI0030816BC5